MLRLSGPRPKGLGVKEGRLRPCPEFRQNCVCSQQELHLKREESPHHVPPFAFEGRGADAMTRLLAVLLARTDCTIVTQTPCYVHAEFRSRFFGFVDDAEFLLDEAAQVIHVRSAARLGFTDFGVNRARVEALRIAFDEFEERDDA